MNLAWLSIFQSLTYFVVNLNLYLSLLYCAIIFNYYCRLKLHIFVS